MLLPRRIAEPLVLRRTEAGVADGHVAGVRPREGVLRRRRVLLRQVVLHHAGVRAVAAEEGVVPLALELRLRGGAGILHPAEHLLEGGEPDVLVGGQAVEELVQRADVTSVVNGVGGWVV